MDPKLGSPLGPLRVYSLVQFRMSKTSHHFSLPIRSAPHHRDTFQLALPGTARCHSRGSIEARGLAAAHPDFGCGMRRRSRHRCPRVRAIGISEGYLESRVGSGTTVHREVPDQFLVRQRRERKRRNVAALVDCRSAASKCRFHLPKQFGDERTTCVSCQSAVSDAFSDRTMESAECTTDAAGVARNAFWPEMCLGIGRCGRRSPHTSARHAASFAMRIAS